MLLTDFIGWWYTAGWKLRFVSIFKNLETWFDYFSLGILLKTMFSPWRQNVSNVRPDQGLSFKISAIGDNLVSRFVGFFVRLGVIIAAIITILIVFLVSVVFAIVWPVLPVAPVLILFLGAIL